MSDVPVKIPIKKLSNGFSMPVYGLGTWAMGGRWQAEYQDDATEIDAIKAAIDLGVTHIDTAESYGDGHLKNSSVPQ